MIEGEKQNKLIHFSNAVRSGQFYDRIAQGTLRTGNKSIQCIREIDDDDDDDDGAIRLRKQRYEEIQATKLKHIVGLCCRFFLFQQDLISK